MLLFSLLQMGASSSRTTPLKCIKKKKKKRQNKFDPQNLKKTHLIFFCDTEWPQNHFEDGELLACLRVSIILLFYNQIEPVENKRNG